MLIEGIAIPTAVVHSSLTLAMLVAVILVIACTVASLAGFGGNLLALPFLVWVFRDLKLAVAYVIVVGTVQSLIMTVATIRYVNRHSLGFLVGWGAAGVPLGLLLASSLPQRPSMVAMGVVILVGGACGFADVATSPSPRPPNALDRVLLVAAGLMHGAFGCGGPTVVLTARRLLPEKNVFRGTLFLFWTLLNVLVMPGFRSALVAPAMLPLLAIGIPCVLVASWAGQQLARRIPQHRFAVLTAVLLMITGGVTIVRSLWPQAGGY